MSPLESWALIGAVFLILVVVATLIASLVDLAAQLYRRGWR